MFIYLQDRIRQRQLIHINNSTMEVNKMHNTIADGHNGVLLTGALRQASRNIWSRNHSGYFPSHSTIIPKIINR